MEWPLALGCSRVCTRCRAAAQQSEKRAVRGGDSHLCTAAWRRRAASTASGGRRALKKEAERKNMRGILEGNGMLEARESEGVRALVGYSGSCY